MAVCVEPGEDMCQNPKVSTKSVMYFSMCIATQLNSGLEAGVGHTVHLITLPSIAPPPSPRGHLRRLLQRFRVQASAAGTDRAEQKGLDWRNWVKGKDVLEGIDLVRPRKKVMSGIHMVGVGDGVVPYDD